METRDAVLLAAFEARNSSILDMRESAGDAAALPPTILADLPSSFVSSAASPKLSPPLSETASATPLPDSASSSPTVGATTRSERASITRARATGGGSTCGGSTRSRIFYS